MQDVKASHVQAKIFDFAITQLVLKHRDSFEPLWSIDSWVKFLIWMALNCGLSGEKESLEFFSEALGNRLSSRMRMLFFERTLDDYDLKILGDPVDLKVLVMPISGGRSVTFDEASKALTQIGLLQRVELDQSTWEVMDSVIVIPRQSLEIGN